jgi:nitrogen regulatory protein PII
MKEIKAVGQPFFLLKIIERLRCLKEPLSITVAEILDFGGLPPERAAQKEGEFVKKWRLEVVVPDSAYDSVLEMICEFARSESAARTEIFVAEVENVRSHDTSSQSESQREIPH